MKTNRSKNIVQEILSLADIKINGNRSWDIQVHNENFYQRVLTQGSLGLGESYMDGWWDCEKLDEFFFRVISKDLVKKVGTKWKMALEILMARIINLQSKSNAFQIGERHYDLGNDLFQHMLDKRMVYSGAYWKSAQTLEQAQEAKLDLVCRKLGLQPGMTVLDIGCGWGSFAKYAAEKYQAKIVGITVSKEQVELGKILCKGLPIEFRFQDYREVDGKFDHIVSIAMFEAVGYKNYRTFMEVVCRCLKDNGLFLLHTLGRNISAFTPNEPWVNKYIFPNGMVPSISQIGKAMEGLFVMEDWHNFGPDYDKTLLAWYNNFESAWPSLKNTYDERFHRMWRYYLLSFAGSFRARNLQLWQIVMTKPGTKQPDCRIS